MGDSPNPCSSPLNWLTSSARSKPCRMHQTTLGLLEKEQPPRSRKQTILHPRQEDGQGLRQRQNPCLWNGQVPLRPFVLNYYIFSSSPHTECRSLIPQPPPFLKKKDVRSHQMERNYKLLNYMYSKIKSILYS